MKVVLDTGIISSLFKIGRLYLVRRFFGAGDVHIPKAVLIELAKTRFFQDFVPLLLTDGKCSSEERWIIVCTVEPIDNERIGLGEREAISLARKLNAVLLIDDQAAKRVAESEEVEAFDLAMFLKACKMGGLIDSEELRRIIQGLRVYDHYQFSKEVIKELLE
jgi:predicted nucleic acid-binding protein